MNRLRKFYNEIKCILPMIVPLIIAMCLIPFVEHYIIIGGLIIVQVVDILWSIKGLNKCNKV